MKIITVWRTQPDHPTFFYQSQVEFRTNESEFVHIGPIANEGLAVKSSFPSMKRQLNIYCKVPRKTLGGLGWVRYTVINSVAITCNFSSSKRELFLVGKSARLHGLSFERAIGAAADFFSRESFNMKRRQQTMLSFLSTAKKSRRQTSNNSLGIRINKYYVLFQFWRWR